MNHASTIQFLRDWKEVRHGVIERNGRLKIDYDLQRLPHCFKAA